MPDISVLWSERSTPPPVPRGVAEDLDLDRILTALVGADPYALRDWFTRPLLDAESVRHRREVFADLADDAVLAVFEEFADRMRRVRALRTRRELLQHPLQRDRCHLRTVEDYVDAVTRSAEALHAVPLSARALLRWREHLIAYVAGPEFTRLAADARALTRALDQVRYDLRIVDRTVEVSPAGDAPDYSAAITNLFARFGSGPPRRPHPAPGSIEPNHMDEQILEQVAALYPAEFRHLTEFARDHADFLAPHVVTFDREIQFYLHYLAFLRRLDTPTCLPALAVRGTPVYAEDAKDLGLLVEGVAVVGNSFSLSGAERVLVVTGPNQGGKTTFARTFGQLAHFAALGCPVPAREACLPLPDRVFTHFERPERPTDPDGRLAEELGRLRDTLAAATADSLIILNESFSATGTADAVRIGRAVLDRIVARGAIAVWVTFFDELAGGGPEIVSMVATTDPEDPARRTYRLERRPADGLAHAVVLAERFGLTADRVAARIPTCG
ncbi:MutS-related protein [Nocardia takedensis]